MKAICFSLFIFIQIVMEAQTNSAGNAQPWFHTTTIYQVYPRSFFDSNGDGIGDIQGIIQKLDYIKSLGYETIWCSPFFKSPQKDFGYDISGYTEIAPEYGTLQDAEQLIAEVHKRGMKIVFDMVMNHTSDEHPWFKESASSRTNPKADWYLWRDKPNGWKSALKARGWHYVKERNQYYWASFLSFQPDLNYRNPEVKKAMFDAVRFWLQKGVDGFRLDMFNSIYKDAEFRNTPESREVASKNFDTKGFKNSITGSVNQPEDFEFARQLRSVCDSFGDRMLLGEVYGNHQMVRRFLGKDKNDGLGLVFNFEMLRFNFKAGYFHHLIGSLEKDFPSPFMPVYVFSNHDRRRSMKRLSGDVSKAKLLHLMQLTVRGVPCMYYGEEIGMQDARMPYSKALDPIPHLHKYVPRFLVDMVDETLNRDELRTPMQWDSTNAAGFSKAEKTWLPVHTNFRQVNVEKEESDPNSLLNMVQQLLNTRKTNTALSAGTLELIDSKLLPGGVLGYKRMAGNEEVLVLINFTKRKKEFSLPGTYNRILSVNKTDAYSNGKISLDTFGGIVLKK
jgi:oligo-1,6-glucosidase/alpha-glucosidase